MSQPHPVIEVALFSQYGSALPAWVDLTEFVRDDKSGIVTVRGRQESTQKFNAGTISIPLDNRFGVFDDHNTASPFYPNLLPMKQIRVSSEYPGMPGLIPDPRFQRGITGWGNAANCTIAWIPPSVSMQRGRIRMTQSVGLNNPAFFSPPITTGFTVGKVAVVSVRVTAATVTGTGPCSPFLGVYAYSDVGGTAGLASNVGSWGPFTVYQAENYLGQVWMVIPAGTQSLRVGLGCINTLAAAKAVIDWTNVVLDDMDTLTVPVFDILATGYVDSWPKERDTKDSVVTMTASDGLKVMGLAGMTTPNYVSYVKGLAVPPNVYLRFHEEPLPGVPATDVRFLDEFSGAAYAQVNYIVNQGPLFGADGNAVTDVDTSFSAIGASSIDEGACLLSTQLSPSTISPWTFNIWFKYVRPSFFSSGHPVVGDQILCFGTATTPSYFGIEWGATGTVNVKVNQLSPSRTHAIPGSAVVDDGIWHMITVVSTGTVYNLYVDGLLTGSTAYVSGGALVTPAVGMMPGGVNGAPGVWPPTTTGTGQYDEMMLWRTKALIATEVSSLFSQARNIYPQERSDQRVTKILDLIGWSATQRNISTQGRQVDPVSVPFFEANPLQYLQKLEDTEGGLLFMDSTGSLTFVDVSTLLYADQYVTPRSTWHPDGPLSYEKISIEPSDKTLFTRAVISRENGAKQIADITKVEYGYRPISKSTINATDEEAWWLGYWYLDHYRVPVSHINNMVVNPLVSETVYNEVMALELGMRIVVVDVPPPGTTTVTYTAMIQGIRHEIRRGRWRTTLDLSDQWGKRYERFGDLVGAYPMGL